MKTTRILNSLTAASLLACLLTADAKAGIVKFITVRKERSFAQTSATAVALKPASANPFKFAAEVDGDDRASIATLPQVPQLTLPANSQFKTLYNKTPSLGLGNDEDDGWNFGYVGKSVFDNWVTPTKAELDAAFPNGSYIFKVDGRVVNLSLPTDTYAKAPLMVLSGGAWVNGAYRIPVNKALTINSGKYGAYGSHINDLVNLRMEDDMTGDRVFDHFQVAKVLAGGPPQSASKSYTRKIPANILQAGGVYTVSASYEAIVSQSTAVPKAIAVGLFISTTELRVIVDRAR